MKLRLHSLPWLLAASTFAVLPFAQAQGKDGGKGKEALPPKGHVEKLAEFGLTLTLPEVITERADGKPDGQLKLNWSAKLGESRLDIYLYVVPRKTFFFEEPEDVRDLRLDNLRERADKTFAYDKTELLSGSFGFTPHGSLGRGPLHSEDGKAIEATFYILGGLLEKQGYSLEIIAAPPLSAANDTIVLDFLRKGVVYAGKQLDPKWTDEEHKQRWLEDAPPELAGKLEKPVRTKHYIFLSNTSASKQMGKSMEEAYDKIRATYPFEEFPSRRLMPVFLFRDPTEYHAFYAKQFKSTVEEARKSKGVAYEDFYATYYDAPQDPVHIHEGTHQVFRNRLHLSGGGSWFQEGVAEYICTRPGDRTDAANAVRKERHTKLAEFMKIESLLWSAKEDKMGGDVAASGYEQAALLIEFVRESKWSKEKFLAWMEAIGRCPRGNLVAIERATQETLGVDVAGLEAKWVEYCKKR